MSEKSLEEIIEKKDKSKKSKSKGKTKFTTTDEIAKKLTEGEKKAAKKQDKKEKEKKIEKPSTDTLEDQPKTATVYQIAGAEEWNEFEDPNEKDYSGLKVQSLQISAEPEEPVEEEEEGEVEIDENGEPVKRKDGQSGPWNKSSGTAPPTASPSEPVAPPPPEVKPEPPKGNVTAGKYVPPSRRAAAAMGSADSSTPSRQSRQKGKHVPQIESNLEFPSLAASSDIAKYGDKNADRNFQEVRKGGSATDNPSGQRPRLELENRYAALGN
ncbi:protein CDV3 homolog A-like [Amphiura filiformis]|uniref:protein CDV3 homolog A-like n=1 Tax=Amphiura filiformis TaxID=82378 RepID=UPI003B21A722